MWFTYILLGLLFVLLLYIVLRAILHRKPVYSKVAKDNVHRHHQPVAPHTNTHSTSTPDDTRKYTREHTLPNTSSNPSNYKRPVSTVPKYNAQTRHETENLRRGSDDDIDYTLPLVVLSGTNHFDSDTNYVGSTSDQDLPSFGGGHSGGGGASGSWQDSMNSSLDHYSNDSSPDSSNDSSSDCSTDCSSDTSSND